MEDLRAADWQVLMQSTIKGLEEGIGQSPNNFVSGFPHYCSKSSFEQSGNILSNGPSLADVLCASPLV